MRKGTPTLDSNIGDSASEGSMFLCQLLLEVLASRGIEDVDAFLRPDEQAGTEPTRPYRTKP